MVLQGGERGRVFSVSAKGFSVWTLAGRIKGISYHGALALEEYLASWQMGDGRLLVIVVSVPAEQAKRILRWLLKAMS